MEKKKKEKSSNIKARAEITYPSVNVSIRIQLKAFPRAFSSKVHYSKRCLLFNKKFLAKREKNPLNAPKEKQIVSTRLNIILFNEKTKIRLVKSIKNKMQIGRGQVVV